MVKRRKSKDEIGGKNLCCRADGASDDASASVRSFSTVSLSDIEEPQLQDDATSRCPRRIVVSLTDFESSSSTSDDESTRREDTEDVRDGQKTSRNDLTEEAFQQHLSVLKCRYRAELEKIEDEIAAAENSYFGTRRTRVGSILRGYGDYATCNMEMIRNKSYCKPVKLGERAFSLSSRSSRIHKEYEEECKNEALRREAQQLAAGYYFPPGLEPHGLEQSLQHLGSRMAMDYYPPTCQSDPYGYMGGQLHGHPGEAQAYGQQCYASYLYTPQNSHLFMNYDTRPSIPVQTPQMMGPSMRIASGSQPFLNSLENGDPAAPLSQGEYVLNSNSSLKRPSGEEELNGGDSNFNVEQFLNAPPTSHRDTDG